MVRTMWRWATGASTSLCRHSAHRSRAQLGEGNQQEGEEADGHDGAGEDGRPAEVEIDRGLARPAQRGLWTTVPEAVLEHARGRAQVRQQPIDPPVGRFETDQDERTPSSFAGEKMFIGELDACEMKQNPQQKKSKGLTVDDADAREDQATTLENVEPTRQRNEALRIQDAEFTSPRGGDRLEKE
jgi:hypothetical protein